MASFRNALPSSPLRLAAGIAVALSLQGCVVAGLESVAKDASLASGFARPDDPQEALGAREHPLVVAKYGGEYRDAEAEKMLALVVGRLVAVSEDPSRVYKVTILDTPKVNAFALPGGYVYVTRGLLALAGDSAEIAAEIAHEMGHVTANHAILRQKKTESVEIGREMVNEALTDSVAAKVALAANQLTLADFSRDQELQADAIGIRMIGRAGFDPFAAARFLETMEAFQGLRAARGGPDDFSFLASHPTTPQRVELARRHARFFGAPGIGENGRDRFLSGIEGLLYGDSAEEGFVRGRSFLHAELGIAFDVPAGATLDNQPKAILIAGPGAAATRFDALALPQRRALSDYMKSGWINGLLEDTVVTGATPSGLEMAAAEAETEGWRFRIKVIRIGAQAYRFITAMPAASIGVGAVSDSITNTFRQLRAEEKAALQPLRIRVVTAPPGAGIGDMAAMMQGAGDGLRLFSVLNGLKAGDTVEPGQRYKIVADR
jgi:predicted Zn-dependent protease